MDAGRRATPRCAAALSMAALTRHEPAHPGMKGYLIMSDDTKTKGSEVLSAALTARLTPAAVAARMMGANPTDQGVTFRVWAPNAKSVCVKGTFNSWSNTQAPLKDEGDGYWSALAPLAMVGNEYRYVIVNRDSGETLEKNDPYARQVTNSVGYSVIAETDYRWKAIDYKSPKWNEMVIYEVHVGSFTVDSTTPIRRGTFRSLMEKLPYLEDLGINAIEVMPSGEFPTDVSLGYNVDYPFAIESSYGGPNGFREFVDAAHRHGIAVILDVVYNHFGPTDLDKCLWRFDGWSNPGYGGVYFYDGPRASTEWGPRPDYGRQEVRQYIKDNAQRWCETRYVDGLRWDATSYVRNVYGNDSDSWNDIPDGWRLMQEVNALLAQNPVWNMKISIAEDMKDNEWLTKDENAGGAGFDSQWDAVSMHRLRDAFVVARDEDRDMDAVARSICHCFNGKPFERVIYVNSHDECRNGHARLPEEIWPGNAGSWYSRKRSALAAALVFTAGGIPMIFQGDEFLESGWFDDARTLDWSKRWKYAGILNLHRDLIQLRRNLRGTTRGLTMECVNVFHVNNTDKLVAYHRWGFGGPRDDVVVVANFANRAYPSYGLGLPRGGLWKVRFNSDSRLYGPDFGNYPSSDVTAAAQPKDGLDYSAYVSIGPYTAVILSQG